MLQQAIPQQKSTILLGLVPANVSHPFSRLGPNERRYLQGCVCQNISQAESINKTTLSKLQYIVPLQLLFVLSVEML